MPCDLDQPLPHFTTMGEAYSWLRRQIGNGTPIAFNMGAYGREVEPDVEDFTVVIGGDVWISRCLRCGTWLAYDHWKKQQLARAEAQAEHSSKEPRTE